MLAGIGGGASFGWIVDFGMALTTGVGLVVVEGVISHGGINTAAVGRLACPRPLVALSPEMSKNLGTLGYAFGGTFGMKPPNGCAWFVPY